jgi:transcriptional regulator with XRE-family HTH domain
MPAETTTGSTVPRRQLGRHLRELRNRARLTVKVAAGALEWSEPKLWRIETGQTSLRSLDVEAMCKVYGAPADLTQALMGLAKETKARGWWHAYGDVIPGTFDLYIGLEEAASQLSWYESELVPGLLQTEDYARTLIAADNPGVSDQEINRRVQVRIARQALLTRVTAPPTTGILLNEAILRRPVGGPQIMAAQLHHLAEAATLPNVSIRVVPFSAGLHHGVMSGPFVILRFPANGDGQDSEPPTVYVDGYTGALYLDKPNEIQRYNDAYADIMSSSQDEPASSNLILQAAKELAQ